MFSRCNPQARNLFCCEYNLLNTFKIKLKTHFNFWCPPGLHFMFIFVRRAHQHDNSYKLARANVCIELNCSASEQREPWLGSMKITISLSRIQAGTGNIFVRINK